MLKPSPHSNISAIMKKAYKIIILLVICLNTLLVCVNIGLVLFQRSAVKEDKPLERLFLTPHLKRGQHEQAQKLAQVHHPKFLFVESYSGYLTVNESTDSHMFFWYFPTEKLASNVPLLLWLNGGPGSSSMYGLFTEMGPFIPISSMDIKLRDQSWHKHFNLLFIDNPVGTGFSLTKNGYVTNEVEVGRDLYIAMQQFFQLFPDLANSDFFITGESYAGKYIPALGYTIHLNNEKATNKINLKGLCIGNGFSDPMNQMNYADYLYQHAIIDFREAEILRSAQDKCISLFKQQKFQEAFQVYSDIITEAEEFTPNGSYISNFTGNTNIYNYLLPASIDQTETYMIQFLNQNDVKSALHVGDIDYTTDSDDVFKAMYMDHLESVAPWMTELLSHYRVLLYSGQLDIIVAYPMVHNYVKNLNFSGAEEYKAAQRKKWYYETELAGYYTVAGNLTEVMVRNAGHMVPTDQPKWAFHLIDRFVNNKTLE